MSMLVLPSSSSYSSCWAASIATARAKLKLLRLPTVFFLEMPDVDCRDMGGQVRCRSSLKRTKPLRLRAYGLAGLAKLVERASDRHLNDFNWPVKYCDKPLLKDHPRRRKCLSIGGILLNFLVTDREQSWLEKIRCQDFCNNGSCDWT